MSIESVFHFEKSIAEPRGRIRCSLALYVRSISWFLVWSAAIVGEKPGEVGAGWDPEGLICT